MDSLAELVRLLDRSELKLFRQFLERKNKRADVKNLHLLNLLETDDIIESDELYSAEKNNDAFYALRKRLRDNLLLFLSQRNFENNNSETYEVLRLIVVGRFLLENEINKIAFKCLNKAERLAEQLEQFNLLNEILLLKIQYAHISNAEDLEILTNCFLNNQSAMEREAKLNLAYAFLRQELQQVHLKGKIVNLTALMMMTIRKYKISIRELMTYKSIYQILFIANEYAAIQQNYTLIERYINITHQLMEGKGAKKQAHMFYHISILYFLANFHLRQKKFMESKNYLKEMMDLMEMDSRYHAQFYLRLQLLTVLNLFFSGSADDAISLSKSILENVKHNKTEDEADLRISLTMFLALTNNRESLKQLSLLTKSDAWYEKQMGMLWTIRKNLVEILIQAQFSNIDLAISRLDSFRRRYKKYLLNTGEERVLSYLKLVERCLSMPDIVFELDYRGQVLAQLHDPQNNDIFTLSFIAWLVARWEKKTAYEIVLSLLNSQNKDIFC